MESQRDYFRERGPFSGSFHTDTATHTARRVVTYRPQGRSEGIHLLRGQIDELGVEKADVVDPSFGTCRC